MRLSILIGGKAGQGINKVSEIASELLAEHGYFTFNYREYPSLIRGGHNFNILSVSDERIGSIESKLDILVALDEATIDKHKDKLKKDGLIISYKRFESEGRNLNITLLGSLVRLLGINRELLLEKVKSHFKDKGTIHAAEKGYNSQDKKFELKKLNNNIKIMTGSLGVALGAINSGLNLYFAYPMTPATTLMNELASRQLENNFLVFQPESEIACVNSALGASFTGAVAMTGTSGGGFDLMTEAFSFQGQSEIPLVVYLASRASNSTGLPTYTGQGDLDATLRAGHGEYPRVVIAPGDPLECIEKTNEAFYLAYKYNSLAIILSDKHLAESEFSSNKTPVKPLKIQNKNKFPGETIVKASSYEHDKDGNTAEDAETAKKNAEARLRRYEELKKEASKFEMIKLYGNSSKNLVISWGSNKSVTLDSIRDLDCRFLHVIYLKPLSDKIKPEMEKAENILLVENNSTGQLGRLIREKTGIKIEAKNRILKYDGRPFNSDELKEEIKTRLI